MSLFRKSDRSLLAPLTAVLLFVAACSDDRECYSRNWEADRGDRRDQSFRSKMAEENLLVIERYADQFGVGGRIRYFIAAVTCTAGNLSGFECSEQAGEILLREAKLDMALYELPYHLTIANPVFNFAFFCTAIENWRWSDPRDVRANIQFFRKHYLRAQ